MKIIKNWEKTNNKDFTYVKSPNLIDFLDNLAKNRTNLLIFNKKNQIKDKKNVKKKTIAITEKNTNT